MNLIPFGSNLVMGDPYSLQPSNFLAILRHQTTCDQAYPMSLLLPQTSTRRLLTLRRSTAHPEIIFYPVESILGTPSPSEIEFKSLDIINPEKRNAETHTAIQSLLDKHYSKMDMGIYATAQTTQAGPNTSLRERVDEVAEATDRFGRKNPRHGAERDLGLG